MLDSSLRRLWGPYLGGLTESFCKYYLETPQYSFRVDQEIPEEEKEQMVKQLLEMYPSIEQDVAVSLLESCDYVLSAAIMEADEARAAIAEQGIREDKNADKIADDPMFQRLRKEFPDLSKQFVALALRKAMFNYDNARLYFENSNMREFLMKELEGPKEVEKPVKKQKQWISVDFQQPAPVEMKPVPAAKSVNLVVLPRKTLTIDLHGYTKRQALQEVRDVMTDVIHNYSHDKVNFIVGQGKHSKGEPVLKPAVLMYLRSVGLDCRIHARNPGIVEAFPSTECDLY